MVPQWFKTPSGRSYGAAAALTVCGNPSPPQGIVGTLVANTLPQFNPIRGPDGPGAADIRGFRGLTSEDGGRSARACVGYAAAA